MAWTIDTEKSKGGIYVNIHQNSGVITYNDYEYEYSGICGPMSSECSIDIESATTTASLLADLANFDDFTKVRDTITYTFTMESCNQEGFVTWFNGDSGNSVSSANTAYTKVLDGNNGFDIKNVDDCMHIIIGAPIMTGLPQKFESSTYEDSTYPMISEDPYSSYGGCMKYSGITTGHKIKYRPLSDTMSANTIVNNDDLVELYFPHLFKTRYPEGDTRRHGVNTKKIAAGAFSGNTRLSAITFSGVEEIGNCAFSGCNGLVNIDWGHCDCKRAEYDDENGTVKERVIGSSAFTECHSLPELHLDELRLNTLGEYAFYNCSGMTTLDLPNNYSTIDTISAYTFWNCTSLTYLYVPDNIHTIGNNAFENGGMTNVEFEDIYHIGNEAFKNCSALESITLGYNIEDIGDAAFSGCTSLSEIKILRNQPPTIGTDVFASSTCNILVHNAYVNVYKAASGWSTYASRIVGF